MRARWFGMIGATGLLVAFSSSASAALSQRYVVRQRGDIVILGNTFAQDCGPGVPAPVVGTVTGNCGLNTADSAPDTVWWVDHPAQGQATTGFDIEWLGTQAVLDLPDGATTTKAWLYWAATTAGGGYDENIEFRTPDKKTYTISPTYVDCVTTVNNNFQCATEVTAYIEEYGDGVYRVSGVDQLVLKPKDVNHAGMFLAWWMVVVYERKLDPLRYLAVYDGLDFVANGGPQSVDDTAVVSLGVGAKGKLSVIAYDGDNVQSGDSLSVGGQNLADPQNPANNFFNGTRARLGVAVSQVGDLPQMTGGPQSMSGIDLDTVDISAALTPYQTALSVTASTTDDTYYLGGLAVAIDDSRPEFDTSVKSVVDLNGGLAVPGDVLEYAITVTNTGTDTATDVALYDILPLGTTYVPGAFVITSGPNAGPKTDAFDGDQLQIASDNFLVFVGHGATSTHGGTLAVGESTSVKLRVQIDPYWGPGPIVNQAFISATGLHGAPEIVARTDGNGPAPGAPATSIFGVQCDQDAQCPPQIPHCHILDGENNACVECITAADCTDVFLPDCSGQNQCTCAPKLELCDGLDNDCNGAIDNVFELGDPCVSGTGECAVPGTLVCGPPGPPVCDAVAGSPTPEQCDGLDNDCDDEIDENCGETTDDTTTGTSGTTGTTDAPSTTSTTSMTSMTSTSTTGAHGTTTDDPPASGGNLDDAGDTPAEPTGAASEASAPGTTDAPGTGDTGTTLGPAIDGDGDGGCSCASHDARTPAGLLTLLLLALRRRSPRRRSANDRDPSVNPG